MLGLFRDVRIAHGPHLVDRVLLDQDVDAAEEVKFHHLAGAPRVGRGRKAAQVGLPKGGLCERVTGQAAVPRHISFTTKGGTSVLMMVAVRSQTTRVEDRDSHLLRSLFSCAMALKMNIRRPRIGKNRPLEPRKWDPHEGHDDRQHDEALHAHHAEGQRSGDDKITSENSRTTTSIRRSSARSAEHSRSSR